MESKIPKWLIKTLIVLAVLAIVYYLYQSKTEDKSKEYGKDGYVKPTPEEAGVVRWNPTVYTDKIKKDIIGLNVAFHDHDLHSEILAMADDRLVFIYNDWQTRYSPEIGETLAEAIADESSLYDIEFASIQKIYATRFKKLGLK